MIQANELRIGNYYNFDSYVIKLDGSLLAGYIQNESEYTLSPIPLTDDQLLDFGFKLISEDKIIYSKGRFQIEKIGDSFIETRYGTNLKHVHKLQNLYFEIIKEELKK